LGESEIFLALDDLVGPLFAMGPCFAMFFLGDLFCDDDLVEFEGRFFISISDDNSILYYIKNYE
tara:strand:+ start:163 stop:354 length:192 start_codon:yes stop_codon:yes gene_type:complete